MEEKETIAQIKKEKEEKEEGGGVGWELVKVESK
jgi:hypothetical protein